MNQHLVDGVLVRGAVYLALAISSGPALWRLLVRQPRAGATMTWRMIATPLLLGFASIAGVVHTTSTFAGEWSLAGARDVLSETAYGRTLVIHIAVSLGHAAVLALRLPAATLATALATTTTLTLLGHASVQPMIHVAVQVAHASAVITWLGMLMVMTEHIARRTLGVADVRRFSRIALALVSIIVVTGVARTASFVIGGQDAITWLGTLAAKLAFFACALAVAWGHRRTGFHGVERAETDAAWRRFQRMLMLEIWFVACALLLAALLSQLQPP